MNNSITFKMTGEEYYLGWKHKLNKGKMQSKALIISFAILVIIGLLIFSFMLEVEFMTIILILLFFSSAISTVALQKKSIIQEYNFSKVLNGENTLKIYGEGMEIITSYEKIFTPWQSVFSVKETPKYIIILPTFRKGIFVISKEKYNSDELTNILSLLKNNVKVEEGKK
ncbi:MAG: YcxB family protein [Eubacterium sp.]